LLWLALQRDDLTEATALADQLLAHSQQLPASQLRSLLESAVQGDGLDGSRIRRLLRQPPDSPRRSGTRRGYHSTMRGQAYEGGRGSEVAC
jgi:hypothetical protein